MNKLKNVQKMNKSKKMRNFFFQKKGAPHFYPQLRELRYLRDPIFDCGILQMWNVQAKFGETKKGPPLTLCSHPIPTCEVYLISNSRIAFKKETQKQERRARREACDLAKQAYRIRGSLEQKRDTFCSPSLDWCLPSPSTIKQEENESLSWILVRQRTC